MSVNFLNSFKFHVIPPPKMPVSNLSWSKYIGLCLNFFQYLVFVWISTNIWPLSEFLPIFGLCIDLCLISISNYAMCNRWQTITTGQISRGQLLQGWVQLIEVSELRSLVSRRGIDRLWGSMAGSESESRRVTSFFNPCFSSPHFVPNF